MQFDAAQRGAMPILHADYSAGDSLAEQPLDSLRHHGRCLARSDHPDFLEGAERIAAITGDESFPISPQMTQYGLQRVRGF
jgi:hypothetical protein